MRRDNGGDIGHPGAELVSSVLKFVAVLVLMGGTAIAVLVAVHLRGDAASDDEVALVAIGAFIGSIVAAAAIAFFAYVLDLLMDIEWNSKMT